MRLTRSIGAILILVTLGSCASQPADAPASSQPGSANVVCMVTDTQGLGDRSFNDTAWRGVLLAQDELGVDAVVRESSADSDYSSNIDDCLQMASLLTVSVGFLIGPATEAAAQMYPDRDFVIVDFAYEQTYPNVLGLTFSTDQAAFLAGYLAAGVSKTGKVGTFGGIQIPTVTIFMDGFVHGVRYYNETHETDVQVLGWDPELGLGLFTNTFDVPTKGYNMGQALIDEGVDIIMPVAGGVGLGTALAASQRGDVLLVGVDTDWVESSPEYADIILTSVTKHMDVAVYEATQSVLDGSFEGGIYTGTLANNGVGLAPFHALEGLVSAELEAELAKVEGRIIGGSLEVNP